MFMTELKQSFTNNQGLQQTFENWLFQVFIDTGQIIFHTMFSIISLPSML